MATAQWRSVCVQQPWVQVPAAAWNATLRRSFFHLQTQLKGKPYFLKQCSWRQIDPAVMPLVCHDTEVDASMWIKSTKLLMTADINEVGSAKICHHRKVACSASNAGANNNEAASGLMKWEDALKNVNVYIPHAVLASTVLALSYPPSFTWFTTKYYAPALGFLMFAVGVNLSIGDFKHAMERPAPIALGLGGQYVLKPLLGVVFAALAVRFLHLPDAISSGLILTSCVSGAQLSNYATFLTDPGLAPLSIVMTALSTALAVVVTPLLTLWLLGKRLPIDLVGMITNITKIVVAPIAGGLFLNRFLPQVSRLIRPYLPLLSLLVTCCCVGSPLSVNINAVRSPFGLQILLPVVAFHTAAFIAGYKVTQVTFPKATDQSALARTISFETGMQSSLLGLALANRFFPDPMVGLPPAISVVVMSLMAFGLVIYWNRDKHP